MKVYYIWDAYCGWCYGFKNILIPFMKNHPELDLEVVSGGLFNQGNPIGAYAHIKEANKNISELFGVEFGEDYNKLFDEGTLVLDSLDAAIGFGILRDKVSSSEVLDLAAALQEEFYLQGHSLSDENTYKNIATKFNLDSEEVEREFITAKKVGKSHPDFDLARRFGVTSYPTLILEKDGKYYDLRGHAMTSDELEKNLETIKNL